MANVDFSAITNNMAVGNVQSSAAANNVQNEKVDLSQKPDVTEFSTNENAEASDKKKIGKYIAIGLAAAGIIAGIAILVKKGKASSIKGEVSKIQKNANKIQSEGEAIKNKAGALKDEVTTLFNNKGMIDGKAVAKITQGENGIFTMEEFMNNAVSRKSVFEYGALSSIDEITKKGTNQYFFEPDGVLSTFNQGYKKLADGSESIAKGFEFFENGKVAGYAQGIKNAADGSKSIAKAFNFFENGKVESYIQNHEMAANGVGQKLAKNFIFYKNGKLASYAQDFEMTADLNTRTGKVFGFSENGKNKYYAENMKGTFSKGDFSADKLEVTTDKGTKCFENYKFSTDEGESIGKFTEQLADGTKHTETNVKHKPEEAVFGGADGILDLLY